jgi:hypothetical protein
MQHQADLPQIVHVRSSDQQGDLGRLEVVEGVEPAALAARVSELSRAAFVADAEGAVFRLEIGETSRLARCSRVAALPAGERATALQWSPEAAVVAVATDQGRILRYSDPTAAEGGGSQQAGSPSRGRGQRAAAGRHVPWQLQGEVLLDGPVAALCLEPRGLTEGVAATAACTAWFVDLPAGQREPVMCGHAGEIDLLVAEAGAGRLVASVAGDGLLRVWDVVRRQVGGG